MALYDSVVANVAGSEEKMERIKDRAGSKTGPIEAQRQHVWSGQMIPKQLILQKQEMKTKTCSWDFSRKFEEVIELETDWGMSQSCTL